MPRRKDGEYYHKSDARSERARRQMEQDEAGVPDPSMEEIAAIATAGGIGGNVPFPHADDLGTAPTGGDELTEEELELQRVRLMGDGLSGAPGRVVGPDIGPPDLMERMTAALEGLNERREVVGQNDQFIAVIAMLAEAINGLRTGQMQAAQLQADMQRRVTRPENAFSPEISAFNPRGDRNFPRPVLKCPMEIPWPVEAEAHTREEIELLNLLEQGEFLVMRSDRSKVKMVVLIHRKLDSEEPSKLIINHETAFNNDNHRQLPYDWIRQLATANPKTRTAAASVITMEEELAFIAARKFNDGRLAAEGELVVSVGQ